MSNNQEMTVADMKAALVGVPDDFILARNAVGNLTIYQRKETMLHYKGFIDCRNGTVEWDSPP